MHGRALAVFARELDVTAVLFDDLLRDGKAEARAACGAQAARRICPPDDVYLTAFERMLTTTCSMRSRSPVISGRLSGASTVSSWPLSSAVNFIASATLCSSAESEKRVMRSSMRP